MNCTVCRLCLNSEIGSKYLNKINDESTRKGNIDVENALREIFNIEVSSNFYRTLR